MTIYTHFSPKRYWKHLKLTRISDLYVSTNDRTIGSDDQSETLRSSGPSFLILFTSGDTSSAIRKSSGAGTNSVRKRPRQRCRDPPFVSPGFIDDDRHTVVNRRHQPVRSCRQNDEHLADGGSRVALLFPQAGHDNQPMIRSMKPMRPARVFGPVHS